MASRRDPRPIWARPEPGERAPRFTRHQIARAALALADAEGFEAVSMRRVAEALGAGTMTLYHYVDGKEDLVSLMDDALMADVLVDPGELGVGWLQGLSAVARKTRAVLLKHRWAVVAMLEAVPGPNGMRHFEQSLAVLAEVPLTAAQKLELIALVDDYVFGHLLRTPRPREVDPEAVEAMMAFGRAELATGRYPHTAAAFAEADPGEAIGRLMGDDSQDARFERGLSALLEGARLRFGLP